MCKSWLEDQVDGKVKLNFMLVVLDPGSCGVQHVAFIHARQSCSHPPSSRPGHEVSQHDTNENAICPRTACRENIYR